MNTFESDRERDSKMILTNEEWLENKEILKSILLNTIRKKDITEHTESILHTFNNIVNNMKPQHTIFENKIQLNKAILGEVATYITTISKSNNYDNNHHNLIKPKKFQKHNEIDDEYNDNDNDDDEDIHKHFHKSRINIQNQNFNQQHNYDDLNHYDNKHNREYLMNTRKLEIETEYESKKQEFKDLFQRKQPDHIDFKESMDVKGDVNELLQKEINMRKQFDELHEKPSKIENRHNLDNDNKSGLNKKNMNMTTIPEEEEETIPEEKQKQEKQQVHYLLNPETKPNITTSKSYTSVWLLHLDIGYDQVSNTLFPLSNTYNNDKYKWLKNTYTKNNNQEIVLTQICIHNSNMKLTIIDNTDTDNDNTDTDNDKHKPYEYLDVMYVGCIDKNTIKQSIFFIEKEMTNTLLLKGELSISSLDEIKHICINNSYISKYTPLHNSLYDSNRQDNISVSLQFSF